jgi:hypothetical protein
MEVFFLFAEKGSATLKQCVRRFDVATPTYLVAIGSYNLH